MSKVTVTGQVIEKTKPVEYSDKFTKSEIVLELTGKYPEYIKFEVVNDDIKKLEPIKTLDMVTVEGYLQGRKYSDKNTGETRYMTTVRMKTIEKDGPDASFGVEDVSF